MTHEHREATALPDAGWFQQIADGSGLVFLALRVFPDIAYEYISAGVEHHIGVTVAEAMADAELVHSHVDPQSRAELVEALSLEPGRQSTAELRWRHRSGRVLYGRCWLTARRRCDASVVLEGVWSEMTELRHAEEDLRHSEQRHRLLAQNAWDVIWTMGLDGSITYVSPAVERVRGFTPQEAMNQTLAEIHPPESAASVGRYFSALFAAIADGTEPPTFRGEHEYYRKDGSIMTGELQVIPHVDTDGKVVEILGVTRDISERKRFESELTRLAVTDSLTGLWNRRHFSEILAADLDGARRSGEPLALLMIDVDHFKSVNDTHGHQFGDRALQRVARVLQSAVRGTDVAGRWGGEEFVVLLRGCRAAEGVAAAENIRRRIREVPVDGLRTVTVSIGVAEMGDDDVPSWLAAADRALYRAKRAGRDTVVVE